MANHCRIASASAIAMCDALVDLCEGDTPPAEIVLYTGAEPDYADDAAGTEVATCACNNPAFGGAAADSGNHWSEADLDTDPAVTDSSATGNASAVSYFRIITGTAGNEVLQGTLGTSGADINLNSTTIGAGAAVTITALQVRVPYNQA